MNREEMTMEEKGFLNQLGNAALGGIRDGINDQLNNARIEQFNSDIRVFARIMLEEKVKEDRIRFQICEKWDLRPSEVEPIITDAKYQINLQKRLNSSSR